MSKLIDYIIDEVRETSDNEDFDATVGLTEEEILKFLNDGNYRLHSQIIKQHTNIFVEEKEVTIVADQEKYTLPSNSHLSNRVAGVEYSYNGDADEYYPLRPASVYNRRTGAKGDPIKYIRKNGKILLLPTPETSGGTLRYSYTRKIKRLDKRRGLVSAVTLDTGTSTITTLTVTWVNDGAIDSTEIGKRSRCTVVDKYGNIKMENILIDTPPTAGAGATISIDSSFTYASGETIDVGDYVISGEYSTTHPELGEEVERYLQAYAIYKVLKKDSSVDSQEALQELGQIEEDIVSGYADISDDISEIPEINDDFTLDSWY
jgi:hypothetical protein